MLAARLRAAARENGGLLLAFDDPVLAELPAWAEERIAEPSTGAWCTAATWWPSSPPRGDAARARRRARRGRRAATSGRVEDLSLKAISDESSEVVRLVRSTLRDALMIGASDIHLETVPAGLAIKFRIDGILSRSS